MLQEGLGIKVLWGRGGNALKSSFLYQIPAGESSD